MVASVLHFQVLNVCQQCDVKSAMCWIQKDGKRRNESKMCTVHPQGFPADGESAWISKML